MPFEISYAEECAVDILHEIEFKNALSQKKIFEYFVKTLFIFVFRHKKFRIDQKFCGLNKRDHATIKIDEFFSMKF